nr:reverse transcriptase domain-containing protein [Tanacetum cinerariifolium]
MEGRKRLGLMETMDIMDPIPCVGSVHCITQDLAMSGVRIVTKWAIRPETVEAKNFLLSLPPMFDSRDFFSFKKISPPKDTETPVKSPIPVSLSSLVRSSLPVRSTTLPPDYPFDDLSKWSRTSTSAAPAMNQAAIRQLIDNPVVAVLEAQAADMANTGNTNRNPKQAHVARKCSYKEFMSYQPFNFKCSEGAVGLICWFEHTESVFSRSNCTEDCKELATLCPTMVSNSEKHLEAFIGGLPQSIEGNVTTSKPQTLDEAINIAQRLMDQ